MSSLALLVLKSPKTNADDLSPAARSRNGPAPETPFLVLSKAFTGSAALDPTTAARTLAAFQEADPETAQKFTALAGLMRDDRDAATLMSLAREQNLEGAASALVAAWYTGTIGVGVKARTVSYREALMYAPVGDGMYPPTYAFGGPAWWVENPPPAGVSLPVEKMAPAPPVTGNPMTAAPPAKPPQ